MNARARALLAAARCPASMRPAAFGLWQILQCPACPATHGHDGYHTVLTRASKGTLHWPEGGEVIMEDSDKELRKHLPILTAATGRVLISGLGLGCVVRGLLSKPQVSRVDVVELDPAIINHIGPEFAGCPRVQIFHGDALTFDWGPVWPAWDYGWHDICHPIDDDGDTLPFLHLRLIERYRPYIRHKQGAWGFEPWLRKAMARMPGASEILGIPS